ncbi:MAG: DUF998 domain-containing protein [Thermoplasmatota archaeon]
MPERTGGGSQRVLATVGLASVAAFVACMLVLHASTLRSEPAHMSEYAHSPLWLLWVFAIFAFVVGGAALSFALIPSLPHSPFKALGLCLLLLAGVGGLLLGTFPMDRSGPVSIVGTIHTDASLTTLASLGGSMLALTPAFSATPAWRPFARRSFVFGNLVVASWFLYVYGALKDHAWAAPMQRLLVGLIAAWFVLLAIRLRKNPEAPPCPPGAAGAARVKTRARRPVRRMRAATHAACRHPPP